jgi:hypothetical protein
MYISIQIETSLQSLNSYQMYIYFCKLKYSKRTHILQSKHPHILIILYVYLYICRVIRPEKVISRALKCETDFLRQTDRRTDGQ